MLACLLEHAVCTYSKGCWHVCLNMLYVRTVRDVGMSAGTCCMYVQCEMPLEAFLACHQYWSAGLSLGLGLNFWALVCGIFFKLIVRAFLRILRVSSAPSSVNGFSQ